MTEFSAKTSRDVAARSMGQCERCIYAQAAHKHHRRLRGRRGPGNTHGAANCLYLCTECHTWAHLNVAAAEAEGVILATNTDPTFERVLWRGTWVTLDDDAMITHHTPGDILGNMGAA